MSELLDRVLAAHKAIRNGHGVSYTHYNGKFMQLMAAGKSAPKYRNQAIWEKYRKLGTSYLHKDLDNITKGKSRK